jgi:putative SOS response-associated peptidase YedK
MCARFTLRRPTLREVADELDAEASPEDERLYRPRYNVAPTDPAWLVEKRGDRRALRSATWDYRVGDKRLLVNLRSETVATSRGG